VLHTSIELREGGIGADSMARNIAVAPVLQA
jgi:hypothetical protein